jgi:uncharacterized protein YdaT
MPELPPLVREKAIEIANALLAQGTASTGSCISPFAHRALRSDN